MDLGGVNSGAGLLNIRDGIAILETTANKYLQSTTSKYIYITIYFATPPYFPLPLSFLRMNGILR